MWATKMRMASRDPRRVARLPATPSRASGEGYNCWRGMVYTSLVPDSHEGKELIYRVPLVRE